MNKRKPEQYRPSSYSGQGGSHLEQPSTGCEDRKERKSGPSEVTCYACGQVGHYLTDAKCPKFGTQKHTNLQRIYAQWIVEDANEETPHSNNEGIIAEQGHKPDQFELPELDYGGSQYDPSEPKYTSDTSEQEGEINDKVRLGALHVD